MIKDSGGYNQYCRTIRVDNANFVETVSDANIFQALSNLDIWNPSSGNVVIIENTNITLPKVRLTTPLNNDSILHRAVKIEFSTQMDKIF